MLGFLQAPSTARRDLLLKLQGAAQAKWEDAKVFEVDAPQEGEGGNCTGPALLPWVVHGA